MSKTVPEVLDLKEAAALLRVCTKTLRELASEGKVPGRQLNGPGSPWRFYRTALLEYLHGDRAA